MRAILVLVLAACVVGVVHAIACSENICDIVRCKGVTKEDCNGEFREKGGFCGCCSACVTIIPAGDPCLDPLLLTGFPPTAECIQGTQCVNGTCQAWQQGDIGEQS